MEAITLDSLTNVMRETFVRPDLQIDLTTRSSDVPGWDSLSHVRLILALEDAFDVTLDVGDTIELADVGALLAYVQKQGRV